MFQTITRNAPESYVEHLQTLAAIRFEAAKGDDEALSRDPVYCGMVASLATCEAIASLEVVGQECNEETIDAMQEATGEVAEAIEALTEALQGMIPRSSRAPRARA